MLSNYRVLDLAGDRGEFAGYLLASLGADVLLVEPPTGSPTRSQPPFVSGRSDLEASLTAAAYNRGKRSVVLDLDLAVDWAMFERLIAGADILIEGWTPEQRLSLGLTPASLAELNPTLVHVSITPFGLDGPKAGWAASDLTVMASASPMSVTGDRDRAPVRVTVPQAFCFAAAAAAGAALLALQERTVSGHGQHIDVSAQQVAALATQTGILAEAVGAPASVRSAGGATMGRMSLRFLYPAKDGHVSITHVFGEIGGPATARLMAWAHESGFCDAEMAGKDWVRYAVLVDSGEESLESWEEIKDTVARFTASLTKADLLQGAVERGLLMAPVADITDVLASEHFAHRGFFEALRLSDGTQTHAPGQYARYSAWKPDDVRTAAPGLGEHTAEVLAEAPRVPSVGDPAVGDPAVGKPPVGNPVIATGALGGLNVLDLTWSVSGPAMTRVLADHGATVVKVESARRLDAARTFIPFHDNVAGIENSALFDNLNAGKHSVALKLSDPAGRAVLDDLIRWADVVIDSLSPRGRRSLGLGHDEMRATNPTVITVSSSLFGLDGPMSELAGYGNLAAALTGFYELTGWPDRSPAGPYLAYTDYTSSHLLLVSVVAALDHRRRTGEGQFIELSQSETAVHFLTPALLDASVNGSRPTRMGNDDLTMDPHGVFPSQGEDEWVAIACQNQHQRDAFAALIGTDELTSGAVAAWTGKRSADEAAQSCQDVGVAAHAVQGSRGCLADPQLAARGHFVDLDHPNRRCLVEGTRFRMSRTPGHPQGRAPQLGEHTFEILTEWLGYDPEHVAELAASEVLE